MSIVALITDFGISDWFTGEVKGVLYGIAPGTRIVDITHEIPPGDTHCAAFVLMVSYKTFPTGTIFCIPVDPDTSGSCPAIIIQTQNYTFVGPDNGVLSWAAEKESIQSIINITDIRYFRNPFSMTFRGRDIFAPVSAHLSLGVPCQVFGSTLSICKHLPFPEPIYAKDTFSGKVLYIDHFGNVITNINSEYLAKCKRVQVQSSKINLILPFVSSYDAVAQDDGLVYAGSTGFIELGVHSGSAAKTYRMKCGDLVSLSKLQ